ncbi:hypothetical protein BDY21DRAFT_118909 [Lineolata rhizophorae]|uniref:Uncharacterized protein n=1 Tax=Lineolata rhizophorae TaxID=578093 RepID=A0A6A6NPX4_9PEZI|nr:hypothetical protein BDY21DRAFT_118909 [Lineolata rhizophorae]
MRQPSTPSRHKPPPSRPTSPASIHPNTSSTGPTLPAFVRPGVATVTWLPGRFAPESPPSTSNTLHLRDIHTGKKKQKRKRRKKRRNHTRVTKYFFSGCKQNKKKEKSKENTLPRQYQSPHHSRPSIRTSKKPQRRQKGQKKRNKIKRV